MKPMNEAAVQHGQQAIDHLSKAIVEETEQGNFPIAARLLGLAQAIDELVNDGQLDPSTPPAESGALEALLPVTQRRSG